MVSFKEAYNYVNNTSSYEIFERVLLYQLASQHGYYGHKMMRYPTLSILVASLCGPFQLDNMNNPRIKELLVMTDYGNRSDWGLMINKWGDKHCRTDEEWNYFYQMSHLIIQKTDQVADYLDENARKSEPLEYYFPELVPFGHFNKNTWPRN